MIQLSLDSINARSVYYVMLSPKGEGFYAAIIVENRNPLLEAVIADFEMTAKTLTTGKP